jgi:hypothetical protein
VDETVTVPDGLSLDPGKARVNVINILHDTPEFMVIEIDMNSKYVWPAVAFGDTDNGASEIWFMTDAHSLHLDESTEKQTMLLMPERTAGWDVMADAGRYTIRIAAWRRPPEPDDG